MGVWQQPQLGVSVCVCVCVRTRVLVHMCVGMYTKASWKSSNWVKVVEK